MCNLYSVTKPQSAIRRIAVTPKKFLALDVIHNVTQQGESGGQVSSAAEVMR